MREITALKDFVIVKEIQHKTENITKGGILLPENIIESGRDYFYEVIAVGPKVRDVKVGNTVYIHPDARRRPASLDGENLFRIPESDITYIKL